jgi:hypothetical protein
MNRHRKNALYAEAKYDKLPQHKKCKWKECKNKDLHSSDKHTHGKCGTQHKPHQCPLQNQQRDEVIDYLNDLMRVKKVSCPKCRTDLDVTNVTKIYAEVDLGRCGICSINNNDYLAACGHIMCISCLVNWGKSTGINIELPKNYEPMKAPDTPCSPNDDKVVEQKKNIEV